MRGYACSPPLLLLAVLVFVVVVVVFRNFFTRPKQTVAEPISSGHHKFSLGLSRQVRLPRRGPGEKRGKGKQADLLRDRSPDIFFSSLFFFSFLRVFFETTK